MFTFPPPTHLVSATHLVHIFCIHFQRGICGFDLAKPQEQRIGTVFRLFQSEALLNCFECSFIYIRVYAVSQPSDFYMQISKATILQSMV
jgi:hypothetical protein